MRFSLSRRSILTALAIVLLAITLPNAIRRLIQTGDPYLFTHYFFKDMLARFSGAGQLRFILQPTTAFLIGIRDGVRDLRTACPRFLSGLMFQRAYRVYSMKSAFASILDLVLVAIILDLIFQFLIFREVHPGAALLLVPVLIAIPYSISRALAYCIFQRRSRQALLPLSSEFRRKRT